MPLPMGNLPSIVEPLSGRLCVDPMEPNYSPMAMKVQTTRVVSQTKEFELRLSVASW